jgi:hypothetical protein
MARTDPDAAATRRSQRRLVSDKIAAPPRASAVPMDDLEHAALRRKLVELKTEHRDLDDVIARLSERQPFDQIQLQRLKKRKLHLKDLIAQIENQLLPDIIA